jgi:hypothetical protein
MQLAATEYQKLDLWAHSFLADVPLHDAFVLDLPGGGRGRTMQDVRAIFFADVALSATPVVAALFRLRTLVGRRFGWDAATPHLDKQSYLHRLDARDREKSLVAPGTPDGPFRVLHVLPDESISEIQNATVHAFLCQALRETKSGYRYYWGVYVKPVSRLTPLYMGLIKPFRHWIVYPAVLRVIREAWMRKYGDNQVPRLGAISR